HRGAHGGCAARRRGLQGPRPLPLAAAAPRSTFARARATLRGRGRHAEGLVTTRPSPASDPPWLGSISQGAHGTTWRGTGLPPPPHAAPPHGRKLGGGG